MATNPDSTDWQVEGNTVYQLYTTKGDNGRPILCNKFTIQINKDCDVDEVVAFKLADKITALLNAADSPTINDPAPIIERNMDTFCEDRMFNPPNWKDDDDWEYCNVCRDEEYLANEKFGENHWTDDMFSLDPRKRPLGPRGDSGE